MNISRNHSRRADPIAKRGANRLATCGAALLLCLSVAVKADDPVTILFYGNSFTIGSGSTEAQELGGVPGVFRELAIAAGHPAPNVENAASSGQTLTWHLSNNTAVISSPQDFPFQPGFQWDYVVLQGYSTRPTHIGELNQYRTDLVALYGEVLSHSPGAGAVLYETWARAPGHSVYTGAPPSFPGGPAQMQEELRDGYNSAEQDVELTFGPDRAIIAPVGDAWENTGWDNLHATDLYHANSRGTYLAALVIYGTVYSESVVGLPKIFDGLTALEAAELQAYADAVIPAPCGFAGEDCNANCVQDWREPDCNDNQIPDQCDIAQGFSFDCDADGVPDECTPIMAPVWQDDFDVDTSSNWTVVAGGSGDLAVFNYDYSADSIPAAPNSRAGTTFGFKLEANTSAGVPASTGLCAYPTGLVFDGDFTLRWDMYISWSIPQSTEHACFGINHGGQKLNAAAEVSSDTDGVYFAVAGDGGVSAGLYPTDGTIKDYNAFYGVDGDAPVRRPVPHWDDTHPYLRELFPSTSGDPLGVSQPGAPGRQWVEGEISQRDGMITWKLNDAVIYHKPNHSGFDFGAVMLGLFDHYSAQNVSGHAFVIYDNVRVCVASDASDALAVCAAGPCEAPPCDPPAYDGVCCTVDFDGDGDVDMLDLAEYQLTWLPPPPELRFQPDELACVVEQDDASQGSAVVLAGDSSTTAVDLAAIDLATQAPPTWLTLPPSWTTGSQFSIDFNAAGLNVGNYYAVVVAVADGYVEAELEVLMTVTPAASGDTILVDFGSPTTPTVGAPRYWNNVHTDNMGGAVSLNNVEGASSGVVLTIDSVLRFNGANTNGATSPQAGSDMFALQYPTSALQDSLFGNYEEFGGGTFPVARITLSGLDPDATYDLVFCSSRMNVADVRTVDFLVIGGAPAMYTLDASNNDSEIAVVADMPPSDMNSIMITIDKGADNTNSYGFYYLNTLEIRKNGE